jgi:uncharacterized Zn finger protein
MSRWGRHPFDGWYEPAPMQPVPARGIAAGRFGATWWGREWIASMERLGRQWSNRLPRGRSYARQGRVVDLEVGAGLVSAGVVGTRPRPYTVEIRLAPFDEETWQRGVDRIADDLVLLLRLLQRELPFLVGERLRDVGIDLFPTRSTVQTQCTCPDVANPCKHVAAVQYLFAAALDNDPFLLFRLRGLDRDDLVADLGGDEAEIESPELEEEKEEKDEKDEKEPSADFDVAGFLGLDLPLPEIDINPRKPRVGLVGLRRLGPPPRGLEALPKLLAPVIRAGGRAALDLAWKDEGPKSVRPMKTIPSESRGEEGAANREDLERRIETVLTEIGKPLLKREILAIVKTDRAEVDRALRRLRAARLVSVQGKGAGTRYFLEVRSSPGRHHPSDQAGDDFAGRVCEVLGASRKALSMRALADKLEVDPSVLRPVVISLRQNGVVEKTGYRRSARYRLAK